MEPNCLCVLRLSYYYHQVYSVTQPNPLLAALPLPLSSFSPAPRPRHPSAGRSLRASISVCLSDWLSVCPFVLSVYLCMRHVAARSRASVEEVKDGAKEGKEEGKEKEGGGCLASCHGPRTTDVKTPRCMTPAATRCCAVRSSVCAYPHFISYIEGSGATPHRTDMQRGYTNVYVSPSARP